MNEPITLTITPKDGTLYEHLKNCRDESQAKDYLRTVLGTYRYCTGDYELCLGKASPEDFRKQVQDFPTEKLLAYKKGFEKEILEWGKSFDPYDEDCGVQIGPDPDVWFVEENGALGWIVLYTAYNRIIDEVLASR